MGQVGSQLGRGGSSTQDRTFVNYPVSEYFCGDLGEIKA